MLRKYTLFKMKTYFIALSLFTIISVHASDPMVARVGTYTAPDDIRTNIDMFDYYSITTGYPRAFLDITSNGESLAYTSEAIDPTKRYKLTIYKDPKHLNVHQSPDDLYRVSTDLARANDIIKKAFALDTSLSRLDRIYLGDAELRNAKDRAEIARLRAEEVALERIQFAAQNKK